MIKVQRRMRRRAAAGLMSQALQRVSAELFWSSISVSAVRVRAVIRVRGE